MYTLHFSMSSKVAALTTEYYEMLEAVYSSPYYTEDPSEACLFIPSIDLLNLQEQVIQNLYQELFILWCGPLNSTSSHLDTNHPTQSDPLKLTTLHPSLTCWYDFTQPRATVSLLPCVHFQSCLDSCRYANIQRTLVSHFFLHFKASLRP